MIGVVLLVGVTVLAVAVVAAVFLSGPQPDEIPHATIVAGIDESGSLALVHEGGDPLRKEEYRIYVDTGSGLVDGTEGFTGPEDGVWSIGGALVYNGAETPERVVVTVISGGSETILAEPEFVGGGAGFSPDPVEPGMTPVGTVTPGPVIPPSSPILITKPLIQSEIDLKNFNCTANITDANVTRVDLLVYDFNETEENKATVYTMSNSSSSPYIYQKTADIQGNPVKKGNYAAITVIAYNGSKAIGHDTIVVKSKS